MAGPNLGNVLIGGGTGFIGTQLSSLLKKKGYVTTIISRMPGPQRISWNELATEGLPKETSAIINLAGQNIMDFTQRWSLGFKQNVFNSRVNTVMALAEAIKKAKKKPEVFVAMSGVSCYKPDESKSYTEESSIVPFDFFSKLCVKIEEASQLATEQCRIVNIRSGVVLGRTGGMIQQMYLPFYLGLGGPIGDGSQFLPWIHIEDLVNLVAYSLETPGVHGVVNGVAPSPSTNKDFTQAFAKALKRPAIFPVPSFVLNILLNKERASMITQGPKVLPKRTQELGFKFKFPTIEEACLDLVKN